MKQLLLVAALAFLFSCNQAGKPGFTGISDIYNKDSVELLMHVNAGKKAEADKYYQEGEKKLRKDDQPGEAVALFTNSIRTYPSARVYFELGNAFMNSKHYEEAIKAYGMAELMDYKPLSKVLYNTACAYSLAKNKMWMAGEYLEYAIESGYKNTGHIMDDPDLKDLERGFAYDDAYLDAMSGVDDPAELLWSHFKKAFAAIVLPTVIDRQSDSKLTNDRILSYKYGKYIAEMQVRERFSREGGDAFYAYGQVADNAGFTAVIYCSRSEMEDLASANYWMVSYNPKGEIIDKMNVAGQKWGTSVSKVLTLNQDLTFEVKIFDNTYQKPPETEGYYQNPIVSSTLTATKEYKINDAGKFEEVAPRIGMR